MKRPFASLYKRYAERIFRYALVLLGRRELAEEVVQETMIAVWRGAKDFQGRSAASTWIFGIARNQALKLRVREANAPLPAEVQVQIPDSEENLDLSERIRRALLSLPKAEREV